MKLLIVGCGYVGGEVAKQLKHGGTKATLFALTRSKDRVPELQSMGVEPILGDWLDAASLSQLPSVDHVLVAVPHRPVNEFGAFTHVRGLANLAKALGGVAKRWVYLSTTGVYGDCESCVVDEATPIAPTRIGPEIAVEAEQWFMQQIPTVDRCSTIVRLAGIYGPGRIPLAAKLRAGEPLAVPREGHLNLVHVVDIARMIVQLLQDPPPSLPLYVFSDGHPVIREVFYRELARQCGVLDPVFMNPEPDDAKVRRATDKRVNPARLVAEMNFAFQYPDYVSGLAASCG